jgi:hypothetical protein
MAKKERVILGALIVGAGLAYLFRDKIAQYISQAVQVPQPVPTPQPAQPVITPIRIWTDKKEYRVGEIVYVYGSATPAEDIDVYVYQGNTVRAIYTIYLKTLNKNYTGFIGSGLCRNCTLTLRGVGRETGNVSNTVEIRILG